MDIARRSWPSMNCIYIESTLIAPRFELGASKRRWFSSTTAGPNPLLRPPVPRADANSPADPPQPSAPAHNTARRRPAHSSSHSPPVADPLGFLGILGFSNEDPRKHSHNVYVYILCSLTPCVRAPQQPRR